MADETAAVPPPAPLITPALQQNWPGVTAPLLEPAYA